MNIVQLHPCCIDYATFPYSLILEVFIQLPFIEQRMSL